ncbi:MAG TPA: Do family serine endopeptidase [Abditibacteriaceae bacterium]|jgi:serine protease Do
MNQNKSVRGTRAAVLGVGAIALAGGYALRGVNVTAQNTGTPVVQTSATRDAVAIQGAFAAVSDAIEPAVVTITTTGNAQRTPAGGTTPRRPNPFGGPGAPGGGAPGEDPFEEFFRRFQRDFGVQPNSATKEQLRQQWLHKLQADRGGGGLGSGMIIRQDGVIITNAHVVGDSDTVTVRLGDEREFKKAKVLGRDERTDIAVVKIEATNLPTVKLGDSSAVRVGDWAIAVGNPFGLEHTVTVGVISAKAREVPLNRRSPGDYLQTDASINPGNSGGPLCDIEGRVIGVNNAIYSQSGGNVGIGFAIPINTAKDIAERLIKNGKITRGYLGVGIEDVDDAVINQFDLPRGTKGVLVRSVDKNTPGERAGLQAGDVVLSFNGTAVAKSTELQRMVGNAPVGSTAQLRVLRDGQTIVLNARLDELKSEGDTPETTPQRTTPDNEDTGTAGPMGLKLQSLTPATAKQFGVEGSRGVLVTGVGENSAAAAAGLQRGDVIERVGQRVVTTPAEAKAAIDRIINRQTEDTKSVALLVNRKGTRNYVSVTQQ